MANIRKKPNGTCGFSVLKRGIINHITKIIVHDNGKNRFNLTKVCNFLQNQLQIRRKDRTFGTISFIINLSNYILEK